MKTPAEVIAGTYIEDFGHHIMVGPAVEILAALDSAGYKVALKDDTDKVLDNVIRDGRRIVRNQ